MNNEIKNNNRDALADLLLAASLASPVGREIIVQHFADELHKFGVACGELPAMTNPNLPRACAWHFDRVVDGVGGNAIFVDVNGDPVDFVSRIAWLVINAGVGNVACGPKPEGDNWVARILAAQSPAFSEAVTR